MKVTRVKVTRVKVKLDFHPFHPLHVFIVTFSTFSFRLCGEGDRGEGQVQGRVTMGKVKKGR